MPSCPGLDGLLWSPAGGGQSGAISTGREQGAGEEEVDVWGTRGEGGGEDASCAPDAMGMERHETLASVNLGWKVSHVNLGCKVSQARQGQDPFLCFLSVIRLPPSFLLSPAPHLRLFQK